MHEQSNHVLANFTIRGKIMRKATIERKTAETQIQISLNLDEQTGIKIDTGIGF